MDRFIGFLDNLKGTKHDALIECIKQAYTLVEGVGTSHSKLGPLGQKPGVKEFVARCDEQTEKLNRGEVESFNEILEEIPFGQWELDQNTDAVKEQIEAIKGWDYRTYRNSAEGFEDAVMDAVQTVYDASIYATVDDNGYDWLATAAEMAPKVMQILTDDGWDIDE